MVERFLRYLISLGAESKTAVEQALRQSFLNEVEWNYIQDGSQNRETFKRSPQVLWEYVGNLSQDDQECLIRGFAIVDSANIRSAKQNLGTRLADGLGKVCFWLMRSKRKLRMLSDFLELDRRGSRLFNGTLRKYTDGNKIDSRG